MVQCLAAKIQQQPRIFTDLTDKAKLEILRFYFL